jgi:hypothetical protein
VHFGIEHLTRESLRNSNRLRTMRTGRETYSVIGFASEAAPLVRNAFATQIVLSCV